MNLEFARLELHLLDAGQTVFASAEAAVRLGKRSNFTSLKNPQPGVFAASPLRRLGTSGTYVDKDLFSEGSAGPRRLGGSLEVVGEFQYPNRYFDFPVPLASRRQINLKVVSADGAHFGFYTLEIARENCPSTAPFFDAAALRCVHFCNTGFFADFKQNRCKSCDPTCFTCTSPYQCTRCPTLTKKYRFILDNSTGKCLSKSRSLMDQHPETTIALVFSVISLTIFLCGLCAFQFSGQGNSAEFAHRYIPSSPARAPAFGSLGRRDDRHSSLRGNLGAGQSSGSSVKYMRVSATDDEY